jgi:branched-chain amino acid transport system permease protein
MRTSVALAVLLAALLIAAPWLPSWLMFLLTVAFAKGLVVLGLVVMMRAGLVSFGQGLYYGLGAYAAGLAANFLGITDALVLVAIGGVVAAAAGYALGFVMARYREIFFAMLSLALSMILYGLLVKSAALGSTDGFGVADFTLLGQTLDGASREIAIFWLALGFAALGTVAIWAYRGSVAGASAIPLRENEIRVEYLGASANRLVHLKVVIAGILASAGGAIVAMAVGHVDPDMSYWTTSGGFVFVAIMAGASSVIAAFAGSIVFELIRTAALAFFPQGWQLILGGVLLATIMFFPNGIGALVTSQKRTRPVGAPRRAAS